MVCVRPLICDVGNILLDMFKLYYSSQVLERICFQPVQSHKQKRRECCRKVVS